MIGIDMSMSSISGSALSYDAVLDKRSLTTHTLRWQMDDHYFKRMIDGAKAHDFIFDLLSGFTAPLERDNTHIGIEEPWPLGIVRRAESGWLKQQAQLQGSFLGGLLRYGYANVYEVNAQSWKGVVARKAGDKATNDFKWRVKQIMLDSWGKEFDVPDLPDLIRKQGVGLVPKPETSKAKSVQPDDTYDAMGVMEWVINEVGDSF